MTRLQTSSIFVQINVIYTAYKECGRQNRPTGRSSILNERTGQLHKAVHCKVMMRYLKRLKDIDDLAPKQNMYGLILMSSGINVLTL